MNELVNVSKDSIVPIIMSIVITLSIIGVLNWKSVLKQLHAMMLALVGSTSTTIDDRLYTLIISHAVIFFCSDEFKKHWSRFEEMISDGHLTVEEVEELKVIFLTEFLKQLKNLGVDIYNDGGKEIIAEAIEEFTEFIKNNIGDIAFFKKPFVYMMIDSVKKWVKKKIDEIMTKRALKLKIGYSKKITIQ
jgi:hypothetical protein